MPSTKQRKSKNAVVSYWTQTWTFFTPPLQGLCHTFKRQTFLDLTELLSLCFKYVFGSCIQTTPKYARFIIQRLRNIGVIYIHVFVETLTCNSCDFIILVAAVFLCLINGAKLISASWYDLSSGCNMY